MNRHAITIERIPSGSAMLTTARENPHSRV